MMKKCNLENVDCHAALAMTKNAQSGRSMIEMLGVLAIIGVLSVGGIAGYSKAMQKYRINKAIEQITLIAGNVRAFFAPQKNYIGVYCSGYSCSAADGCIGSDGGVNSNGYLTTAINGCPIIKKAKILPDEMITVNAAGKINSITNPFGGKVDLGSVSKATSGDNQAFMIIYYMPAGSYEECIEIVSHDWTAAGVSGIRYVFHGGPQPYFTSASTVDEIVSGCSKIPGAYSLEFKFDVNSNCNNLSNTCS